MFQCFSIQKIQSLARFNHFSAIWIASESWKSLGRIEKFAHWEILENQQHFDRQTKCWQLWFAKFAFCFKRLHVFIYTIHACIICMSTYYIHEIYMRSWDELNMFYIFYILRMVVLQSKILVCFSVSNLIKQSQVSQIYKGNRVWKWMLLAYHSLLRSLQSSLGNGKWWLDDYCDARCSDTNKYCCATCVIT